MLLAVNCKLFLMCVHTFVASFKFVTGSHSRQKGLVIGNVLNIIYNAATEKILDLEFMSDVYLTGHKK